MRDTNRPWTPDPRRYALFGFLLTTPVPVQAADSDGDGYDDAVVHPTAIVPSGLSFGAGAWVGAGASVGVGSSFAAGAQVAPKAQLGTGVDLLDHSTVGRRSQVGNDGELGASAFVAADVTLGASVILGPGALVGHGATLGDGVELGDGASVGNLADVAAGASILGDSRVGRDATVGDATIGSVTDGADIGADVQIGDGTTVGPGASLRRGAQVGEDVLVEGAARIGRLVSIGDDAHVGLGATLRSGVVVPSCGQVEDGDVVRVGASIPTDCGSADPHAGAVVSLLHFDDAVATAPGTLADAAGASVSNLGVDVVASPAVFGNAGSIVARDLLTVSDPGLAMNGDFTIELWVRPAGPGRQVLIGNWTSDVPLNLAQGHFTLDLDGGSPGLIELAWGRSTPGGFTMSTGSVVPIGAWSHVVLQRNATHLQVYVGGHLEASFAYTGAGIAASTLTLGGYACCAGYDFTGHVDELRVTAGVARYTGDFTPPTAPYPNP
jgi:UDP-3-O-[3-hydroxymyristoyl] glucosamine N-acyltransferase